LTSRETIAGLIAGGTARIGLFDWGPWPDTFDRWIGEGYPTERQGDGDQAMPVSHSEYFDYDMIGVGGWFDALPIRGVEEIVKEEGDWKYIRNGAGAIWRQPRRGTGSVPELVECSMTNRAIWEREYREPLLHLDRERIRIEATSLNLAKERAKGKWTFYADSFVWEKMRNCVGTQTLLETLIVDPEWIHDFCRVYTDFYKTHYRLLIEEAGRPDGVWILEDLAYKNGLACSPKMLEELIFPYYREMMEFFREYDLPVLLHSDGHIDEALPLIVDAGFTGINPIDLKAGCDLFRYADQYKDDLVFVGGFDTRVLESGDPPQIRKEVIRVTSGMRERGARYVFGVDHTIPPTVSLQNFEYALQCFSQCR